MQLSAEERQGVMDLIADYAHRLESGDLEGYVQNFTEDGVFEVRGNRYEGCGMIRDLVSRLYAIGQDGPNGNRHILGLPWISGSAQECRAETYVIIVPADGELGSAIRSIAKYSDRIVRQQGRWRFAHRRLVPVLTGGGTGG